MAKENLAIAQHRDTLRYACIRSGAYRLQLRRFSKGDYVYLQREAPTTLDVKAGRTILRVKDVLPSGILLLEGKDGRECREHSKNCAPCHLPIDGFVHPELAVVPDGLPCFVCGEKKGAATMLLCDRCQRGWHMACSTPPLSTLPSGDWICPRCRKSFNHMSLGDKSRRLVRDLRDVLCWSCHSMIGTSWRTKPSIRGDNQRIQH